jgi:glycosyltransferase involved in cell wall biosynthesis
MIENHPLFTVTTVTYNSSKWIREAIESILSSSFGDFELLIADDCSTDDTWEIVNEYQDPRIRSWRNEKNVGQWINRNRALKEAKGKYIIFVDGDDVLYQHTLRNLSEYVDQFPEAVSIWGVFSQQLLFCIFPVLLQPKETMNWVYAANLPIAFIGLGETVFKVDIFREIGGFSNEFIASDTHSKKRIAMEGPVLLVPSGLMFWRTSDTQQSQKLNKGLRGYVNNVLIDRDILSNSYFNQFPNELSLYVHNCKVRDVKVLFKHTFMKGKFFTGIAMWKKMKFKFGDLAWLFKKADFSYLDSVKSDVYHGRSIKKASLN